MTATRGEGHSTIAWARKIAEIGDKTPTVQQMLATLAELRVTLAWCPNLADRGWLGCYVPSEKQIYIVPHMRFDQFHYTLAHETRHAMLDHDGSDVEAEELEANRWADEIQELAGLVPA